MAGRTPVPPLEEISSAKHQATMIIFLSTGMLEELTERLLVGGYKKYSRSHRLQGYLARRKVFRGTVGTIKQIAKENNITKTALIMVETFWEMNTIVPKLYDPGFSYEFREATK